MNFSKKIQQKINTLFENNEEVRVKLLEGDSETIRQIAIISQKGIDPKDIVTVYESNDTAAQEQLYKKAKKALELQKLYKELCQIVHKKTLDKENDR